MGYMEPPRLYQPVKHCLGYVLMQAGNHQKAAEVRSRVYPAKRLVHRPRGCMRSDGSLHECISTRVPLGARLQCCGAPGAFLEETPEPTPTSSGTVGCRATRSGDSSQAKAEQPGPTSYDGQAP